MIETFAHLLPLLCCRSASLLRPLQREHEALLKRTQRVRTHNKAQHSTEQYSTVQHTQHSAAPLPGARAGRARAGRPGRARCGARCRAAPRRGGARSARVNVLGSRRGVKEEGGRGSVDAFGSSHGRQSFQRPRDVPPPPRSADTNQAPWATEWAAQRSAPAAHAPSPVSGSARRSRRAPAAAPCACAPSAAASQSRRACSRAARRRPTRATARRRRRRRCACRWAWCRGCTRRTSPSCVRLRHRTAGPACGEARSGTLL